MSNLFSDDDEPAKAGDHQLTINEHYAKAFEYRKEREELTRLKEKYGSDYDPDASDSEFSTDSESAESEDEHGEELTPAVDAAILRTLARIRKKDPEIYNSQKNIFGEESERLAANAKSSNGGQTKSKSKSKPVTLRQVNLEAMLNPSRSPSPDNEVFPLTHVEEQEALRRKTISVFHGAVTEEGEDDFLVAREKTQDERDKEEEEYRAFLEREVGDLQDLVGVDGSEGNDVVQEEEEEGKETKGEENKTESKKKRNKSKKKADNASKEGATKSKADKDQEFLMNYILNRGWIDRSEGHIPTYKEVTSTADERRKKKGKSKAEPQQDDATSSKDKDEEKEEEEDAGLLSDTSFESLASHFEASYNHRFEEPGAATIPSFPRNLPSLVRRLDSTRKEARERRKQRKDEELQKKREEVKRLKALKMREVRRKLEVISRQGGLKLKKKLGSDIDENGRDGEGDGDEDDDAFVDEALQELDLEGEWDPEKHDRQMANLFDRDDPDTFEDDDQGVDGGLGLDEDGKPVWDDDVDIGDILPSDDDAHFVSKKTEPPSKKEKKKKKKKKKGGEEVDDGVDVDAMDADAPLANDDDEEWDGTEEMRKRKLNEYMDQVYGLDFNDMVGDLPTRFKYVPIQPQGFALTPAEILMATDQELNEYVSVKKYAPYRQDKDRRWNTKNQEKLRDLKSRLGERGGSSFLKATDGRIEEGEKTKKRLGKKERKKLKAALGAEGEEGLEIRLDEDEAPAALKPKKRKRSDDAEDFDTENPPVPTKENGDEGDENTSMPKKKKKRRHRKKVESEAAE